MKTDNLSQNRFVLDPKSTADLRSALKSDPKAGLKAAAQQFEGLFLQMVMKSMRDATPQDGIMDSDQTRFFSTILDQQLAQNLSGKLGFAKLIEQQLGRNLENSTSPLDQLANQKAESMRQAVMNSQPAKSAESMPTDMGAAVLSNIPTNVRRRLEGSANGEPVVESDSGSGKDFVNKVWPHAVEAANSLGVPPHFLVAQSALESGWGKSEIKGTNGASTFNIFGIKAGKNWQGATVDVPTTEYVNGQAQTVRQKFKAYSSYSEAFQDYASLLRNNPRYGSVVGQQDGTSFARSLQQAGYATDPQYADKLARIINGSTLRQALAG